MTMTARGTFCPQFDQLEERAVPSALGLGGARRCFTVNTTITGTLSGLDLVIRHLRLGPLRGKAVLTAVATDAAGDHSGTLVVKTSRGSLTFTDTGHVDLLTQQFTEEVMASHGTGAFRGASGALAIDGSFDFTGHFSATVMGQVCP
jgi:hypothetical protein